MIARPGPEGTGRAGKVLMLDFLKVLTSVIPTVCLLLMVYQYLYMIHGLFVKPPKYADQKPQRYAVMICARNEEKVVPHLVRSILEQDYPAELIRIFVCADNCTDHTADAARAAGAVVYERSNRILQGKGHALNYLLKQIDQDYNIDSFDGFAIFDADNLLEKNYFTELNKVFNHPCRVVTTYRNSKNYGDNWISACSGLWFVREARFINQVRSGLGFSCLVSGTGYVIHRDVIRANNGWHYFLLTEDVDFSTNNILANEKIGYCRTAIFFDEQPTRLIDTWNQRMRWTKGFYQVFGRYGLRLIARMFTGRSYTLQGDPLPAEKMTAKERWTRFGTCYDVIFTLTPGYLFLISAISMVINILLGMKGNYSMTTQAPRVAMTLIPMLIGAYAGFYIIAIITVLAEWKNIYCSPGKKIGFTFVFPLFMFIYIPMTVLALFFRIRWKPIAHNVSVDMDSVRKQQTGK